MQHSSEFRLTTKIADIAVLTYLTNNRLQ